MCIWTSGVCRNGVSSLGKHNFYTQDGKEDII
ncbi:unnamed protein product [Spirodela intermedia]|uniref:Uncharacterized protein n=1 Tax=Spirodela intermedia TaxID=51605 RepID=A0A7I8JCK7_SPIIN|nr:unnamed protein product [Spirodela intermedia]CAA6667233.1 unnamed protein product [Spirodela intermedia]